MRPNFELRRHQASTPQFYTVPSQILTGWTARPIRRQHHPMPEIRIETVREFIAHSHAAYTVCPLCGMTRNCDLDRFVRLGLGDRLVVSLRLRCGRCRELLARDVAVKIMVAGYRRRSERPPPDNVLLFRPRSDGESEASPSSISGQGIQHCPESSLDGIPPRS